MLEEIGKKHNIVTLDDLRGRIAYLETIKTKQEDVLKLNLVEVHRSLQPIELIKSGIDKLRTDTEVQEKAGGLIGSLGLNYVVGKLFKNRKNTPTGFVKSLVVQQVASFLYKKNEKTINRFVGNLTKRALRKIHALEDEEPLDRLQEERERLTELETEEDQKLLNAKTADIREPKEKPLYEKDDPRIKATIDPKEVEEKKKELED